MKIENKIRSLIREEIKKIMLQEKFASSKITNLLANVIPLINAKGIT